MGEEWKKKEEEWKKKEEEWKWEDREEEVLDLSWEMCCRLHEIVEAGTTNKVKSINAKRGKRRSNRRVIIFVLLCSFVFLLFCFFSFLFFCFLL